MRFAILGDHPDGWAVAAAIAGSKRHQIDAYCGSKAESEVRGLLPSARVTTDLEEILADPEIGAAIVASKAGLRVDQLRRVLQSERSALCVHPLDPIPDAAYEINMLQGDTHQVVVPILPLAVDLGVREFSDKLGGAARLIELEYHSSSNLLFDEENEGTLPHFPGWEILRILGGTIAEVQAFAREESVRRGEPVTAQGRFENGALFRAAYLPGQREARLRLSAILADGVSVIESISVVDDDWRRLVDNFDAAVARLRSSPRAAPGAGPTGTTCVNPSWLDEIRAAELDDAARRSIERRRAVTLDYQEVSEEVGFKGTMTLLGCGLLWFIPLLLLFSVWFPYVGWLIVPVLLGFLLLQLLRWFVPPPSASAP
jgi:hypothetical protein